MSSKDYILALFTGVLTGLFLQPTLSILKVELPLGIPLVALTVIMPVLWVLGIWLGGVLSRFLPFMAQFAKYVAAGFLSAAIDFGVLNLLLLYFGVTAGSLYSLSKAISALAGNINAYAWNKLWTFKAVSQADDITAVGKEYGKFLLISVVGLALNVGVASFIVNVIRPQFGISPEVWANLGVVAGAAIVIIWNFTGYKFFVFKK